MNGVDRIDSCESNRREITMESVAGCEWIILYTTMS